MRGVFTLLHNLPSLGALAQTKVERDEERQENVIPFPCLTQRGRPDSRPWAPEQASQGQVVWRGQVRAVLCPACL